MITTDMEKLTFHRNAPVLPELIRDNLIDALQVQCDVSREE